ncbi:aminotransferase class I/II-fold pyridoxal phosphate-dependent enzyme [Hansschlegelia quercus]|uniref:Aminotransferase class I/II-fold pyridoxal phosphate-dependent enzyme n=1 Tax=Hansschlegelia quercus TaxID=2528245 RepID=A0A4Q9GKP2_9HYPH|nr:aminotransferase class I/II-fold pyridoxal phosphate-dependent enzyme [Hansschlegelia quercus]TBN54929.1 aminotransferase class I/II-fold pyridoxal phosphate-dependent enzyme [Hansschlegelia quercus]
MIADLSQSDLEALGARVRADYDAFRARGLKLDMTRGKPAPEQLDLAEGMLALPGNRDHLTEANEDARNYGGVQGLAEVRAMFAPTLGVAPAQVIVGDNASLAMMHDAIVWALLKGVPGSAKPWSKEGEIAFLCPVPGYDRHFAICEEYGIRMIPVPMTGDGPDMAKVEELVRDPAVKGMWCVPKYSNPSAESYSDETVRRLASMKTAAPDFRLFWDNAYVLHHLTDDRREILNVVEACAEAGNPDRPFVFASTSKMTLAGAGLAFFASSEANVKWWIARASKRTIGPDKLNQLRHVRFLKDEAGLIAHMDKHRALLAPKFEAVTKALSDRLANQGAARWIKPAGGYFVSVDVTEGAASRVVQLAKEAGLLLTAAGATWPYGKDPNDSNLRLAPSYPSLKDVKAASEGIAICIQLAAIESEQAKRKSKAA